MAKLFQTLSREELENVVGADEVTEQTASDEIANDADAELADQQEAEITEAQDQIQEGNDAIDESNDNIEKIDEALGEKTEASEKDGGDEEVAGGEEAEVTPTNGETTSEAEGKTGGSEECTAIDPVANPVEAAVTAAVATESLKNMVNRLGLDSSSVYISHEGIKNDPITSLKLAREGFKDIVEKVWRAIRELFQKIWAKLKTWTAQIIGKIKNFEKQVEKLKKEVQDAKTDLGTEIKEDDRLPLFKLYPAYDKADLGVLARGAADDAGKQSVKAENFVRGAKNIFADDKSEIRKVFKGTSTGALSMSKVKFEDKEAYAEILRPNGSALVISTNEGKFRVSKQKLEYENLDEQAKKITKYLTKQQALEVLGILEPVAKGFKADSDKIMKIFEDGRKAIDDEIKKLKESKDESAKAKLDVARQASTIIAIGIPELLFARLDYFKAALTMVAKSVKAGGGSESKSDDKAEEKKDDKAAEGSK